MEKKSDRRIRRTKALLRHGLAQLMSEKSVNEVTVKELVDLVDINRSTFYLHYTDIYNMLESVEDELFDEILHTIRTHPVSPRIEAAYLVRYRRPTPCTAPVSSRCFRTTMTTFPFILYFSTWSGLKVKGFL